MHAGLKANFSFLVPVAWDGPSPSTVIHSLGYLGQSVFPFLLQSQGFSSSIISGHCRSHSHPHTHAISMYMLVSLGRPYETLARGSISDNLGLLEKVENCLLCTGKVQLLSDWGGAACAEGVGRQASSFLWVPVTSASSAKAPVSLASCSFHPLQGHILAVTTTSGVMVHSKL